MTTKDPQEFFKRRLKKRCIYGGTLFRNFFPNWYCTKGWFRDTLVTCQKCGSLCGG